MATETAEERRASCDCEGCQFRRLVETLEGEVKQLRTKRDEDRRTLGERSVQLHQLRQDNADLREKLDAEPPRTVETPKVLVDLDLLTDERAGLINAAIADVERIEKERDALAHKLEVAGGEIITLKQELARLRERAARRASRATRRATA